MAYVRRRGNQLAIVHGKRAPDTGKVEQTILFTIYSKPEALEIVGKGDKNSPLLFTDLMERQYPGLTFGWKRIMRDIERQLDVLPDTYEYRQARLRQRFHQDLCSFTRQVLLTEPQDHSAAAELIKEHRYQLEYLADLLQWRLKTMDLKHASQFDQDNAFYWRSSIQRNEIAPDLEEAAAEHYERQDYDRARSIFELLVDCFDDYAEGHNYLGLIALDQQRLDDATGHFSRTMELGRKLFPARIAKTRYWSDFKTRPYLRGLMNLTTTLNEAGKYDEALALCERLEHECGQEQEANDRRAKIWLNMGRWEEAARAALHTGNPCSLFVRAFALFERGDLLGAAESYLGGGVHYPGTAVELVGRRQPKPKDNVEVDDFNAGVYLHRGIGAFLGRQTRASKSFFRGLVKDQRVASLLQEAREAEHQYRYGHGPELQKAAGQRLDEMRRKDFATIEAAKLFPSHVFAARVSAATRSTLH